MPPENTSGKQKRIDPIMLKYMIGLAVIFDLTQAFLEWIIIGLFINPILDFFILAIFWKWFSSQGVSFRGTRAIVFFGLAFLELFPVLGGQFPLWTLDVIAVIAMVKLEDKTGMSGKDLVNNPRGQALLRRGVGKGINAISKTGLGRRALDGAGINEEARQKLQVSGQRLKNEAPLPKREENNNAST